MSNLLESFYILFASDAEDVQKGADAAATSTDKLEERLDGMGDTAVSSSGRAADATGKLDKKLKDTDKSARETGDSFAALARRAVAMLAPIVGLAAMRNAVSGFVAGADAAGRLADSLRMDVEELQAWQGAATRSGGSAEGLAGSVKNLNATLYDMQRLGGGEAGAVLYRLGVSSRDAQGKLKSADKVLLELSGKFQGLSRERAVRLGEKLGLDEGTVLLLHKGRKGVEDLIARQKELGLYSKREAEDSRTFNNSLADMRQAFQSVVGVVISAILPVFTGISEGLTTAALNIRKHKELVTGFFIGLALVFGALAISSAAAFAPFLAFAALVLLLAAAFAVAYDDVMNFLEGNDSVIGRLSQDYPALGEMVLDLVEILKFLWEAAKAVGTMLVECIQSPQQAFEHFSATMGPLLDKFTQKFPRLGQAIKDIGAIVKWLFDMAMPLLKALLGMVGDVVGFIFDKISQLAGLLGKALGWVAKKIRGEGDKPEDDFNLDEYLDEQDRQERKAPDWGEAPAEERRGGESYVTQAMPTENGEGAVEQAMPSADAEPAYVQADDDAEVWAELEKNETVSPFPATKQAPWPEERRATEDKGWDVPPPRWAQYARPLAAPPPAPVPASRPVGPSLDHTPWALPPDVAANVDRGRVAIAQTNTPLASVSGAGLAAGGREQAGNRSYHVTVERVDVNTQAQDAQGISQDIGGELERELRIAVDNFDDGVAA